MQPSPLLLSLCSLTTALRATRAPVRRIATRRIATRPRLAPRAAPESSRRVSALGAAAPYLEMLALRVAAAPELETLTVYSTPGCPHCVRAKRALDDARLAYEVIDVSDATARKELEARSGVSSVPQVYLGDERVGGADDTVAALAAGTFDGVVAAAAPASAAASTTEMVDVAALTARGGPLNALAPGGAAAIAALDGGTEGGVPTGDVPARGGPDDATLDAFRRAAGFKPPDATPTPADAAAATQRAALAVVDAHVTADGRVDYAALKTSPAFARFVGAAARLRGIASGDVQATARDLTNRAMISTLGISTSRLAASPQRAPKATHLEGAATRGARTGRRRVLDQPLQRFGAPRDGRARKARRRAGRADGVLLRGDGRRVRGRELYAVARRRRARAFAERPGRRRARVGP